MTEIKKANELVKMVEEFTANEKRKSQEEANEITKNIVDEILVPYAMKGVRAASVPCNKHKELVVAILRENGYICERYNNEIHIRW